MRSEKIKWQVQRCNPTTGKWLPRGTFETRSVARAKRKELKQAFWDATGIHTAFRVVRKITGGL